MESYINNKAPRAGMVSVIVPVYNGENHIKRCLDSICQQTYKTFEVIVVDDGSTDSTYSICENISSIDNRIRVIRQSNKGVTAARKAGLEMATGEFVMFVDADDYCLPDYVETMVLSMDINVQLSCAVPSVNEADAFIQGNTFVSELLMNRIFWGMPHKIYRRNVLARALEIDRDFNIAEDLLANLIVGLNVGHKLIRKVQCMSYVYVDNPDSVTHKRIFSYEYETKLINKVVSIVGEHVEEFRFELWYFKLRCMRGLVYHKAIIPNYECLIADLRREWVGHRYDIGVGDKCLLIFRNQWITYITLNIIDKVHDIFRIH